VLGVPANVGRRVAHERAIMKKEDFIAKDAGVIRTNFNTVAMGRATRRPTRYHHNLHMATNLMWNQSPHWGSSWLCKNQYPGTDLQLTITAEATEDRDMDRRQAARPRFVLNRHQREILEDGRQAVRPRFVLSRHQREILEDMEEHLQYLLDHLHLFSAEAIIEILVPRPLVMAAVAVQIISHRKNSLEPMRCLRIMKRLVLECPIPIAVLISHQWRKHIKR